MNADENTSILPNTISQVHGKPLIYLDNAATTQNRLPLQMLFLIL